MNEQLVVKNFGPIKDATVDFKRVTVFIGPTGGGKSTLAKLAAVFRNRNFFYRQSEQEAWDQIANNFSLFGIGNFSQLGTDVNWQSKFLQCNLKGQGTSQTFSISAQHRAAFETIVAKDLRAVVEEAGFEYHPDTAFTSKLGAELMRSSLTNQLRYREIIKRYSTDVSYLPADRAAAAFLTGNIFRLQSHQVGIISSLINFLSDYEEAREFLRSDKLSLPFLKAKFYTFNNRAFVQVLTKDGAIETALADSASGLQSSAPLAVVANYKALLDDKVSFIIEEPELNLYPTAQQGLLNWLVEKCIKTNDKNDLTITTHSPYILSHLNLLLYAHQVGNKDEEKRAKVRAIIPEEYWINPDEFAAYYVNGPEGENGVRSLVDAETKLISQNGLDTVSGIQADQFDQLLDINSGF